MAALNRDHAVSVIFVAVAT